MKRRVVIQEDESRPSGERKFLFCMKREGKRDRNQRIDVALCRNKKCRYLEEIEGDSEPKCTHPSSLVYASMMKKLDKGEMDIKQECKKDQRLDENEDTDDEVKE